MDVLRQPGLHLSGSMDRMAVDNEEYLPPSLTQEASEEVDEHLGAKSRLKDHEVQPSSIRDGRDHVAAETLSGAGDHRSLPAAWVGSNWEKA